MGWVYTIVGTKIATTKMYFSSNKTAKTKMFFDRWSWDDLQFDLGRGGGWKKGLYLYFSQIWTQAKDMTDKCQKFSKSWAEI